MKDGVNPRRDGARSEACRLTTLTSAEQEAAERARELIAETELFDELGLHRLAAKARMVARDVAGLAVALEAERSVRAEIQARAQTLQGIIGRASYDQVSAAVAARKAA